MGRDMRGTSHKLEFLFLDLSSNNMGASTLNKFTKLYLQSYLRVLTKRGQFRILFITKWELDLWSSASEGDLMNQKLLKGQ